MGSFTLNYGTGYNSTVTNSSINNTGELRPTATISARLCAILQGNDDGVMG